MLRVQAWCSLSVSRTCVGELAFASNAQETEFVDVKDPRAVLSRLEEGRIAFAQDGPLVPAGYVFSGYAAQARERLPAGVQDLVLELADAIADSGPFEIGLSASEWLPARRLTDAAARSLREGSRVVSYGKTRQALLVTHGIFEAFGGGVRGTGIWRLPLEVVRARTLFWSESSRLTLVAGEEQLRIEFEDEAAANALADVCSRRQRTTEQ